MPRLLVMVAILVATACSPALRDDRQLASAQVDGLETVQVPPHYVTVGKQQHLDPNLRR